MLFLPLSFAHLESYLSKEFTLQGSSDVKNVYDLCYSCHGPYQSLAISFSIKHSLLLSLSVFHLPLPNSRFHHLCASILSPETMVLDIGKHTFNYPWPHISLKYLHCTTPQGDTVHDLSPNLFMCQLLGRDASPLCLQYVYILLLNHGRV